MRADELNSIDNFAGLHDMLALDKSKHHIPMAFEAKKTGNSKTGGIFAHVELPSKKRRATGKQSAPSASTDNSATDPKRTTRGGKKKKVVFSNLFD